MTHSRGRGVTRSSNNELATVGNLQEVDHPVTLAANTQMEEIKEMFGSFFSSYSMNEKARSEHEKLISDHGKLRSDHETLNSNYVRLDSKYEKLSDLHDHTLAEVFELKQKYGKILKDNQELHDKYDKVIQDTEATRNNADDIEMQRRLACLVVSNVPVDSSKSDEDLFIELCSTKLEAEITKHDIANVSRIRGINRSNRPNAMVIRFQNERARNRVFFNKKKLKGSGQVISEFLTPKRSALLKECYDKIPGTFNDRSIWTHFSKILVKKAGSSSSTYEIKSSIDIQKFLDTHHLAIRPTA